MAVKGVSVVLLAGGGILVWSGLTNKAVTSTIQELVKGKQPQAGPSGGVVPVSSGGGVSAPIGSPVAPVGNVPGINQANRTLARVMAAARGWTGNQWNALDQLWTRESRFQNTIKNPNSTAYGIAQFLDSTWSAYGPKTSVAALQIKYGLQYIKDRYGNPVNAWAHEESAGWY